MQHTQRGCGRGVRHRHGPQGGAIRCCQAAMSMPCMLLTVLSPPGNPAPVCYHCCTAVRLRLAGGTATSGRLEVQVNGVWGTVSGRFGTPLHLLKRACQAPHSAAPHNRACRSATTALDWLKQPWHAGSWAYKGLALYWPAPTSSPAAAPSSIPASTARRGRKRVSKTAITPRWETKTGGCTGGDSRCCF